MKKFLFTLAVIISLLLIACGDNTTAVTDNINQPDQDTTYPHYDVDVKTQADTDDSSITSDSDSFTQNEAEGQLTDDSSLTTDEDTKAVLMKMSPQELHDALTHKDFLLINVHIPFAGEIAGTDKHLAYDNMPAIVAYIGVDLNVKVVVYCLTNYMSTIAGNDLVSRGYHNIYYLDGGMSGWESAGYEIINKP